VKVLLASRPELGGGGTDVFIYKERPDGKCEIVEPMEFVWREMNEVDIAEPTMRLDGRTARAFFQAFAETLSKDGIETEKDARLKGTLDAQKYHLEDLREMLKLGTMHDALPD